jgi:hypothetical protein
MSTAALPGSKPGDHDQDSLLTDAPMTGFPGTKVGTDSCHHSRPHPSTLRVRGRPVPDGALMSMAYLAQPEQQQQLEWLDGGTLAMLLDGKATDGQLMMGRFDVSEGEAPPYHKHLHEDEIFLLLKGTALVWCDDQEYELATASPPRRPTC